MESGLGIPESSVLLFLPFYLFPVSRSVTAVSFGALQALGQNVAGMGKMVMSVVTQMLPNEE